MSKVKALIETVSESPEETYQMGVNFRPHITAGSVLCFYGNLGAGKTTCIKGICRGLGVTQPVTSPTFTLINEYDGEYPVYHLDFYRIVSEIEVMDMGIEEYFQSEGVCLVEWPERIVSFLPLERFEFQLSWEFALSETQRNIIVNKVEL